MECKKCGSDYSENYYKTKKGKVICEECLLYLDEIQHDLITYYSINGEYIGTDEDIEDTIYNICEELEIEKIN